LVAPLRELTISCAAPLQHFHGRVPSVASLGLGHTTLHMVMRFLDLGQREVKCFQPLKGLADSFGTKDLTFP
jgi:hypothetical protein